MKIDRINLYHQRLLIFLETEPQSNVYNQILVTPEQFKKVSDAICSIVVPKNGNDIETVSVETSEEIYKLPDLQESQ